MAYGTISNEWLNKNNLETLWAAIVRDFVHAGANPVAGGDGGTTKGAMLYWDADSTPTGTGQPKQPAHLQIGSEGQFLGVSASGVPQWQSFGTPSLALAGTAAAPSLTVTVQGKTSSALALPLADATHAGLIGTGAQTFGGNKTFNGTVTAAQLISSAAQGTAPIVVGSTTKVTNLNADLLDGTHANDLFSNLSNTNNDEISLTIGDSNATAKKLVVNYATIAGSLRVADKYAWGQKYFDGGSPIDVSGNMSSVGNIEFNAGNHHIGTSTNHLLYFDMVNGRIGIGTETPQDKLHVKGNMVADWGVAAYGIADLSHGGSGGGGGTVTAIAYGDVPIQNQYLPSSGIVTLPNNPAVLAWNNDYQTLTSTQKTNLLNLYAKTPSELWTQGNELADKNFVNSSVATGTATHRGTNTTATTESEFLAWANTLTHNLNDYVFWKTTDAVGNVVFKRYKYGYDNTETGSLAWRYEYDLNNSSFTAVQWAAINSGITSTHVTKLGTIESGAQVNIIETIKRNGTALTVTDKTVDISVPTALSQLTDDSTHRLVTDTQISNWTEAYNAIPILSNSIGQVAAIAGDNSENIVLIDGRVTDLESYFTGADVNNALHLEGHDASYFSSSERVTTLEGYFSSGSAKTALKWTTPRAIKIASSDGTGESTGVNLDGSVGVTLLLPSTIKATLSGNAATATKFSSARTIALTGNITGSADSDGESGWSIATTISDDVIENKMIKNGTIQNAKLVNSSITLNGSAVSLGGSRTINVVNGTGDNADKIRTDNGAWMTVNYASTTGKLKTAVKINNTDFDGSQAITTALWGTARNIRITDADNSNQGTQVSVNGSTDYSLPLPTDIKVGTLLATELVRSNKNIEAGWGVSAMGIADLTMSAGGGGGTVTGIKYNSSSTIYTPTGGIITLPDSVSGITWDTATRKIKVGVNGGTPTDLVQFGTAAMHAHGDYATAVTISGTNLSVTKGDGTAVTTAINAATLQGHAADYFALASYFNNGVAKNAARLSNTDKIGDTNQPVYFTANGVPAAISYTIGRNVAAGEDVTPYTQGDSINITNHVVKVSMAASESPSASGNSISFIDTISQNTAGKISATKKTIYTASSTQLGLVKVGSSLAISDGVLNVGTGGVTNAMLAGSIANDKLAHSSITIGSQTVSLGGAVTAQQIATDLALGTAATHAHGDYVTAIGTSGKTLTWAKGGTAQTAITVPYAKEATTLETEPFPNQEFIFRNSPKTIGADSLKLDRILGRTVVWNQLLKNGDFSDGATGWNFYETTGTVSGGQAVMTIGARITSAQMYKNMDAIVGHKYYQSVLAKASTSGKINNRMGQDYGSFDVNSTNFTRSSRIVTCVNSGKNNFEATIQNSTLPQGATLTIKDFMRVDLTVMFGAAIDGMTNAQILAMFEALYPNAYYDYNEGQLINNAAEGLETVGFNLYGGNLEFGNLAPYPDGSSNNYIRTTEYVSAFNGQYYFKWINIPARGVDYQLYGLFYDGGKNIISRTQLSSASSTTEILGTAPVGTRYIKAFIYSSTGFSSAELNSIEFCLNKSDVSKNGQYEPYKRNVLPLNLNSFKVKDSQGNIITITGGLKQAGSVYDEIVGNKLVKRVGTFNMGNANWAYASGGQGRFYTSLTSKNYGQSSVAPLVCSKYSNIGTATQVYIGTASLATSNGSEVWVYDTSYSDAESFKTGMSGVELNYELATPIEYELISPIPTAMPAGTTERRLPEDTSDSVLAPFACDMTYGTNPGDIARDLNNMWHIQGDMQTRLDGISISHYKTTPSLALEDNHVVQEGNNKLYIKFHATDGDATTNPQTLPGFELAVGTDNDGEHEETFSFGTVTEADILAICHL